MEGYPFGHHNIHHHNDDHHNPGDEEEYPPAAPPPPPSYYGAYDPPPPPQLQVHPYNHHAAHHSGSGGGGSSDAPPITDYLSQAPPPLPSQNFNYSSSGHGYPSQQPSDRTDHTAAVHHEPVESGIELRKMLDVLVHASLCRSPNCQYPNCRSMKGLFRHGNQCKTRSSGGCLLCKKMWYLIHLHAQACKESQCSVPRCRDLKERVRRLQQQSDLEMLRQRAAGNGE